MGLTRAIFEPTGWSGIAYPNYPRYRVNGRVVPQRLDVLSNASLFLLHRSPIFISTYISGIKEAQIHPSSV